MSSTFDGIRAQVVPTGRLRAGVLERPADEPGTTVVFVHGNVSSSLFWQPLMLALPADVRALAVDLRGFGDSETLPVDATRGLRDYADDVWSVVDALAIDRVHLVGWSMGGGVVLQQLLDRPDAVASVTLISPVSPYGFGGTATDGTRLTDDDAGVGAGGANPDFVARLASGDRTADEATSPRSVFRSSYVAHGYASEYEDLWVESMLTTKTGEDNYPGDAVASPNWPGLAAGTRGVLNTMAPKYFDVSGIVGLGHKPPLLWIHGESDAIVGDESFFDLNTLGKVGVLPDWPGEAVAPPQPMLRQTRTVLERYAAGGGRYRELELANCGHSAHIEQTDTVAEALENLLNEVAAS
ncbi:alpha/beta fold hydrolase [Humibacter sp. RRB41]|uniref:alpha/beta fold hydrolase n=1 Tax=Humibacter sp. RRB41 TaxID=2919946 RepID=UPI001FA96701|nr:alpha/beta hydrolase [Humibacter sp. RRB41]